MEQHFGFLFLWVTSIRPQIATFPDRTSQTRYFPMTFQFWLLAGQYSASPHGFREWRYFDRCLHHLQHSVIWSAIAVHHESESYTTQVHVGPRSRKFATPAGVRAISYEFRILLFSCPHGNSCEKTAWYTIFMFVICTLLVQVVLTLRFGTLFCCP